MGVALIAFGLQFFYTFIGWTGRFLDYANGSSDSFFELLSTWLFSKSGRTPLLFFILATLPGMIIWSRKDRFKYFALVFVILEIADFAIGTILSFYILFYIFAISENDKSTLSEESK